MCVVQKIGIHKWSKSGKSRFEATIIHVSHLSGTFPVEFSTFIGGSIEPWNGANKMLRSLWCWVKKCFADLGKSGSSCQKYNTLLKFLPLDCQVAELVDLFEVGNEQILPVALGISQ